MTAIIPAAQRDTAPRGAKMLIEGPTGVGKTSLLRTLDPATCLFVDIESGDLAVSDVSVDTLRPRTWQDCRDLAVYLAGANPAVLPDAVYSARALRRRRSRVGSVEEVEQVLDLLHRQHHRRRPAVLRLGLPAAGSVLGAQRQARSARCLRTARPRDARLAHAPAAGASGQRHPARDSRERDRRIQSRRAPPADGRRACVA